MSPIVRPRKPPRRSLLPRRPPTLKLQLSPQQLHYIGELRVLGLHGGTNEEVVMSLLERGLQDAYRFLKAR